MGKSAGALEYTGYISVKGKTSPNECPGYMTDSEAPQMQEIAEYSFIAIVPRPTLSRSGSTWEGQIELNYVLMLNWITNNAWYTIKPNQTKPKLNWRLLSHDHLEVMENTWNLR